MSKLKSIFSSLQNYPLNFLWRPRYRFISPPLLSLPKYYSSIAHLLLIFLVTLPKSCFILPFGLKKLPTNCNQAYRSGPCANLRITTSPYYNRQSEVPLSRFPLHTKRLARITARSSQCARLRHRFHQQCLQGFPATIVMLPARGCYPFRNGCWWNP